MLQEIECKFFVSGDYKLQVFDQSCIVQGYISSVCGRMVCVCICDGKGYLIIKGVLDVLGISCYEWEKELFFVEVEELMKFCELGVIDKICYLVCSGKYIFEVDEFYGENEGFVVVEVELGLEDEVFVKFGFIGEEVMGDICYYNLQLMKKLYIIWLQLINNLYICFFS